MIDLDVLRKVVERATGWGWEAAYRQDVAALISEVELLRSFAADCEQHAEFATEKATALERAAVVAWLRSQAFLTLHDDKPHDIADRIERGDHRREVK